MASTKRPRKMAARRTHVGEQALSALEVQRREFRAAIDRGDFTTARKRARAFMRGAKSLGRKLGQRKAGR